MQQLVFHEREHKYVLDGIELPSVTTITRFASYDAANGAATWLRDMAADRGSRVHAYCQMVDFDGDADIAAQDADCIGYVAGYKRFLRDYRINGWEAVEMPCGSTLLGFAGTLDRIGYIDGKLTIVDIKTSGSVHKLAWGAQLNGYKQLATWHGYAISQLMIVQVKKTGEYRALDIPIDEDVFRACKLLHDRNESYKRRQKK